MRAGAPLLVLLFLAACPEQVGQQCPPNTVPIGQYALGFAGQHPDDECRADVRTPDAAAVARDDGGTQPGALCSGSGDGGPAVWLVIPGKSARQSVVLADGGFHFPAHSDPILGTACVCAVAIDETFDGFLESSGASFAPLPDGGLPEVNGLSGTLTQHLSTDAGAGTCACDLPCEVVYSIRGVRQ
jgi:hypothetical protein